MLVVRTSKRRAHSLGQLIGTEQTVGFDHLTFAMNPFGLDCVEPRALLGQQTTDDPHPFLLTLFQSPVAPTDPAANLAAYVPACVVPDQHQHLLADGCQLLAAPLQKARGYRAHRAAVHKAQPRLLEFGHVQSVARDGLRSFAGIIFFDRLLYKTQWLASFAKAVQVGLPHPAPPALVLEADHPIGLILRQVHQSVAPPFFLWYKGSGEVIQCLALCQRNPIRESVARTVSPLMRSFVSPSSKLTSAAIASVHRLLCLPNSLGLL